MSLIRSLATPGRTSSRGSWTQTTSLVREAQTASSAAVITTKCMAEGPDKILGGKHSDSDSLYGERGNDTIYGVDEFSAGWPDYIDCGDGTDTAYVDGYIQNEVDVVVNSEM